MYELLNLLYLPPLQSQHLAKLACHCEGGTTEAIQLMCYPELVSGAIFKIDSESPSRNRKLCFASSTNFLVSSE